MFLFYKKVQTCSGAHPASCSIGTNGPFLQDKVVVGMRLITHLHLVPRLRMSGGYTSSSSIQLYGMYRDNFVRGRG